MTTPGWVRVYLKSVAAILFATALAKGFSLRGSAPILSLVDPVFGLENRVLMALLMVLEFTVAGLVLLWGCSKLSLIATLWLATSFLFYRLGSALLSPGKPCPCLGSLTDKIGISPGTADWILGGVVIYMLLGAAAGLSLTRKTSDAMG